MISHARHAFLHVDRDIICSLAVSVVTQVICKGKHAINSE